MSTTITTSGIDNATMSATTATTMRHTDHEDDDDDDDGDDYTCDMDDAVTDNTTT